jgi:hypothetical protein
MIHLALALILYTFTLWLGLYLLQREPDQARVRYTALGLIAYALGLLLHTLGAESAPLYAAVSIWPPILWLAAVLHLLPEDSALPARAIPWAVLTLLGVGSALMLLLPGWLPFLGVAALMIAAWVPLWRARRTGRSSQPWTALVNAGLFFGVSAGLLFLPIQIVPLEWGLLLVGVDMVALGLTIGRLDSLEAGESFAPDARRSLLAAAVFSGLLAAHALLLVDSPPTTFQRLLLFSLTSLALVTVIFGSALSAWLDRLTLVRSPAQQQAQSDREQAAAAAAAATRQDASLDLHALPPEDFDKLTRRTLSHLGDLTRLASSPLTRLPVIEARLKERGEAVNTLSRAAELQSLLREHIDRLRPRGNAEFGTSDDWRYYNALYFPYVVGLRPYARADHDGLNPSARAALDWLRTQVPERTLYNWQNAAAHLIAQDLRETQPPALAPFQE